MNFHILTLFPDMVVDALNTGILGKAVAKGIIGLDGVDIRDFSHNRHRKVDDYTYGGGAGLLMQAQPIYEAVQSVQERLPKKARVIYMTPQGRVFTQEMASGFSREDDLILLCGHYEGIDERVLEECATDFVSIGDYVLSGGEIPAMVLVDTVSRLVPGVLHNEVSAETDSFQNGLLEYPQYSRPEEWHGRQVPQVLLSGDHAKVDEWRLAESLERTRERRPDLYKAWLKEHPPAPVKRRKRKADGEK
ncbi:MAG: tRNA (guanosine(37)-N1)-methyltransferase TrmD [Lachnospiraceae bacterium]|jgi:tRNA (guanine37-N1)-methyltransferase|nr:tRNA (guanosine(37)-N1)-methyltransferase TrmD [Lachnospiraceae bacterium]